MPVRSPDTTGGARASGARASGATPTHARPVSHAGCAAVPRPYDGPHPGMARLPDRPGWPPRGPHRRAGASVLGAGIVAPPPTPGPVGPTASNVGISAPDRPAAGHIALARPWRSLTIHRSDFLRTVGRRASRSRCRSSFPMTNSPIPCVASSSLACRGSLVRPFRPASMTQRARSRQASRRSSRPQVPSIGYQWAHPAAGADRLLLALGRPPFRRRTKRASSAPSAIPTVL